MAYTDHQLETGSTTFRKTLTGDPLFIADEQSHGTIARLYSVYTHPQTSTSEWCKMLDVPNQAAILKGSEPGSLVLMDMHDLTTLWT